MKSFKNGWKIIKSANMVFIAHPKLAVPIFLSWALMAPALLYLKFSFAPQTTKEAIFGVGLFIVIISILITMSCSIVLELIEQHESGHKMSLIKAGIDSWFGNFIKILPVSMVYAFIWFIITVINAILRPENDDREDNTYSAENAARTMAGADTPFSLSGLLSGYLLKAIRMLVFLILPAICWENRGSWEATKRGWKIFANHKGEFISGFFMTELAAILVFLPPAFIFYFTSKLEIELSEITWYGVMLYTGMAWSYSMYLEQMFSAELFLWYKKWENVNAGRDDKIPLSDIEKPSLLDEVFEFVENRK